MLKWWSHENSPFNYCRSARAAFLLCHRQKAHYRAKCGSDVPSGHKLQRLSSCCYFPECHHRGKYHGGPQPLSNQEPSRGGDRYSGGGGAAATVPPSTGLLPAEAVSRQEGLSRGNYCPRKPSLSTASIEGLERQPIRLGSKVVTPWATRKRRSSYGKPALVFLPQNDTIFLPPKRWLFKSKQKRHE